MRVSGLFVAAVCLLALLLAVHAQAQDTLPPTFKTSIESILNTVNPIVSAPALTVETDASAGEASHSHNSIARYAAAAAKRQAESAADFYKLTIMAKQAALRHHRRYENAKLRLQNRRDVVRAQAEKLGIPLRAAAPSVTAAAAAAVASSPAVQQAKATVVAEKEKLAELKTALASASTPAQEKKIEAQIAQQKATVAAAKTELKTVKTEVKATAVASASVSVAAPAAAAPAAVAAAKVAAVAAKAAVSEAKVAVTAAKEKLSDLKTALASAATPAQEKKIEVLIAAQKAAVSAAKTELKTAKTDLKAAKSEVKAVVASSPLVSASSSASSPTIATATIVAAKAAASTAKAAVTQAKIEVVKQQEKLSDLKSKLAEADTPIHKEKVQQQIAKQKETVAIAKAELKSAKTELKQAKTTVTAAVKAVISAPVKIDSSLESQISRAQARVEKLKSKIALTPSDDRLARKLSKAKNVLASLRALRKAQISAQEIARKVQIQKLKVEEEEARVARLEARIASAKKQKDREELESKLETARQAAARARKAAAIAAREAALAARAAALQKSSAAALEASRDKVATAWQSVLLSRAAWGEDKDSSSLLAEMLRSERVWRRAKKSAREARRKALEAARLAQVAEAQRRAQAAVDAEREKLRKLQAKARQDRDNELFARHLREQEKYVESLRRAAKEAAKAVRFVNSQISSVPKILSAAKSMIQLMTPYDPTKDLSDPSSPQTVLALRGSTHGPRGADGKRKRKSPLVIDVLWLSPNLGAQTSVYKYNGGVSQEFRRNTNGQIFWRTLPRSYPGGQVVPGEYRCLTAVGDEANSPVVSSACKVGDRLQQFTYRPKSHRIKLGGLCLTAPKSIVKQHEENPQSFLEQFEALTSTSAWGGRNAPPTRAERDAQARRDAATAAQREVDLAAARNWRERVEKLRASFAKNERVGGYGGLGTLRLRSCADEGTERSKRQRWVFPEAKKTKISTSAQEEVARAAKQREEDKKYAPFREEKAKYFRLRGSRENGSSGVLLTVDGPRIGGNLVSAQSIKSPSQHFHLNKLGYISWQSKKGDGEHQACLAAPVDSRPGVSVASLKCTKSDARFLWKYNEQSGQVHHVASSLCVSVGKNAKDASGSVGVTLRRCKAYRKSQRFSHTENVTVDKKAKKRAALQKWSAFDACRQVAKEGFSANQGVWQFGSTSDRKKFDMRPYTAQESNYWQVAGSFLMRLPETESQRRWNAISCNMNEQSYPWYNLIIPARPYLHMHPGHIQSSITQFTSPISAKLRVKAVFITTQINPNEGPTVDVTVAINGQVVFTEFIHYERKRLVFRKEINAKQGDKITVRVGSGRDAPNNHNDSTFVNFKVTQLSDPSDD